MALGGGRKNRQTPYHLLLQREQLRTPLLDSPTARIERRGSAAVREAWTDVGDVSAGRRRDLRKIDNFSQILTTLGWTQSVIHFRFSALSSCREGVVERRIRKRPTGFA